MTLATNSISFYLSDSRRCFVAVLPETIAGRSGLKTSPSDLIRRLLLRSHFYFLLSVVIKFKFRATTCEPLPVCGGSACVCVVERCM